MSEKHRSKILVVDDDVLNVRLIEAQLMTEYDIRAAYSGEEALDLIDSDKPDLVILDVMMPGMSGYDICRRMKSSKDTCFIPVIIVTALSSRNDRMEGIMAGADEFLTKPFDRFEVLTRVRTLLKSKQLYDELIAEGDRTKKYLDIAGCMIVAFDIDLTATIANAKCNEVLGYAEGELIGSCWLEKAVPADERGATESLFRNILKGDISPVECFESNVLTKTGQKKLISWRNSYVKDSTGKITTILSSGSDITEQRHFEQKIKVSEEKFRALFENAVDSIMILDMDHNILEVNPSLCDLLLYRKDEMLQLSRSNLISPEHLHKCKEYLVSALKEGQSVFETECLKKDGSRVPVEMSIKVIEYEGKPAILSNGRDISERKKSQEAIQKYVHDLGKANESLYSLDKMKDEFISNLSHELKTPLISIKGYSELVHDEVLGPLTDKQKNAMHIVLDKYDHLSFLLDSLIYISIARSGKVNYRFDPLRIEDALKKVMDYFSFKATDKNIKLVRNFESGLPLIKGDVEYIPYIFRSVIDNAIKFSKSEGVIEVSTYRDNGNVHVVVKDNGIGIPRAELSNIFSPFYQVDSSLTRRYGGSGLGLHVSKTITEVHGGSIWIESEEGKGTAVHVSFPSYSPSRTGTK
jgi:PAS domain S-box-containing protein